ncbi:UNVERIFIED_CONTAM: hypothetical protein POZ17_15955 [Ralstonia mannitolilytica]
MSFENVKYLKSELSVLLDLVGILLPYWIFQVWYWEIGGVYLIIPFLSFNLLETNSDLHVV